MAMHPMYPVPFTWYPVQVPSRELEELYLDMQKSNRVTYLKLVLRDVTLEPDRKLQIVAELVADWRWQDDLLQELRETFECGPAVLVGLFMDRVGRNWTVWRALWNGSLVAMAGSHEAPAAWSHHGSCGGDVFGDACDGGRCTHRSVSLSPPHLQR